jgi:hypothetical protein
MYRIREVDGHDDEIAETLAELHGLTFFDSAPLPNFGHGHWWLVRHATEPVAFAGVIPSTHVCKCRLFLSGRRVEKALWMRTSTAIDACAGSAVTA